MLGHRLDHFDSYALPLGMLIRIADLVGYVVLFDHRRIEDRGNFAIMTAHHEDGLQDVTEASLDLSR